MVADFVDIRGYIVLSDDDRHVLRKIRAVCPAERPRLCQLGGKRVRVQPLSLQQRRIDPAELRRYDQPAVRIIEGDMPFAHRNDLPQRRRRHQRQAGK